MVPPIKHDIIIISYSTSVVLHIWKITDPLSTYGKLWMSSPEKYIYESTCHIFISFQDTAGFEDKRGHEPRNAGSL